MNAPHKPTATSANPSPYVLKASPFGSHRLLLRSLRAHGSALKVLDVGGGEGYLSSALAKEGHQVTCLAKPGSVAHDFPEGVALVETDLDACVPSPSRAFDAIICGDVLEHLRDPWVVLSWLRRQLRDDGVLIVSVPNGVHAFVRLNVLFGRFPQHNRGLFDRTHLHYLSWSGWARLFRSAGFRVVDRHLTPVPFSVLPTARRWRPLAYALESAALLIARLLPGLWAYQFVVALRKTSAVDDGTQ